MKRAYDMLVVTFVFNKNINQVYVNLEQINGI